MDTSSANRGLTFKTFIAYMQVIKRHPWLGMLAVVTSSLYVALLTYANTYCMGIMVDQLQAAERMGIHIDFWWFSESIFWLFIINAVGQTASKLQDYSVYKLDMYGNYELSQRAFTTLANQSMSFHSSNFGGSLVSQTTKFTNGFSSLLHSTVYALIPTVASVVVSFALLIPRAPLFSIFLALLLVIYVLVATHLYKKILPLSVKTAEAQNKLSGLLSDAVSNILAVKTCGQEDYEHQLFNEAAKTTLETERISMRATMKRGMSTSSLITLMMLSVSIFMAFGSTVLHMSASTLIMMFTYTYQLSMRFNYINTMMSQINTALGNGSAMCRIFDEPLLVADLPDAPELVCTQGELMMSDLSFSYHQDSTAPVFDHFNLTIPAGQRLGLVGKSGSGKTTLTKLILRLSDVQDGSILLDGQDIRYCTQQSLRKNIAYVPQEPLLFHRPIRENIAYGRPDATDEEIYRAAEMACCTEFIFQLPQGFDTLVGERGVKLSGGQRQRIAIARALLIDAPVLILDEATSALDSTSEALVQQALQNLMHGRTTLVVAHRLSTVASLDRIVVLDKGHIAEDGTHEALLKQQGLYAELWKQQTQGSSRA